MPFGEDLYNGVGARDSALKYNSADDDVRQKFTGYQKDEETQLDFAEARMYENRHARFTAVDPLLASGNSSNPQTFNRFVYVGNNPINITDPTGEKWAIRHFERDGNPKVDFRWYERELTDEQKAQGWSDYDYRTNRFYVSENFVWYLARDPRDFVQVTRKQFDFVNGEGSFQRYQNRGNEGFTYEDKQMMFDAALYALRQDNRDPVLRKQKEIGEQIGYALGAAIGRSIKTPSLAPKTNELKRLESIVIRNRTNNATPMLREALNLVRGFNGNQQQRAQLINSYFNQIKSRIEGWKFTRTEGTDGSIIFIGNRIGRMVVVDKQGRLWGANLTGGKSPRGNSHFLEYKGMDVTPRYEHFTRYD